MVGYEKGGGRRVDSESSTSYVQQCTQPIESWSTVRNSKLVLGSIRALFSAFYFFSSCLRLYLEILGGGGGGLELFFADDLVIITTSLEECVERVKAWKEGLESKGINVNMTKTKFMASGLGLDILQDSGKFPCAVCRTGVGRSSIRCSKCNLCFHYKKCSGLKTLTRTCPMNALVAVVSRVYSLSTAALSRRLRLVTVCSKRLIDSATWVICSVLAVAVWLLPLLDAGVPGVSFEKTFLCSHPSLCLST